MIGHVTPGEPAATTFILRGLGPHKLRTAMEQQGTRTNHISIAVIDDQPRLWQLMAALSDQGIAPSQYSLWGLPDRLAGLAVPGEVPEPRQSAFSALLARADRPIRASSSRVLSTRSGPAFEGLLGSAGDDLPQWLPVELARKLADQAASGGVVLLVSALTPGQHNQAARLLLVYGSHDLHTHEFSSRYDDS